ncbi:hypothetical protein DM02DRAFT_506074, partial [Periconia macrospinosa]
PWALEKAVYETLFSQILDFSAVLPNGTSIPSQNVLIRCLEKYLRCGCEFLPMVHCAKFRANEKPVELVLAMAALGSRYLFESTQSHELYLIAKAITFERIRREDLHNAPNMFFEQDTTPSSGREKLERLQTLVLLTELASWADPRSSRDAPFIAGHLAVLVRRSGISESDKMPQDIEWFAWITIEERRRTLFAAYILSNLHSIAFGSPPLILNHEIGLCLPGHAAQWRSACAAEWKLVPRQPELHFQAKLSQIFDSDDRTEEAHISSFGNYLLIQGIIQEMYQQCVSLRTTPTNREAAIETFERALQRWQKGWETMQESSHDSELDPLYAKGPFALTSAALFRLAHIRLVTEHNLSGQLLISRDPQCILKRRDVEMLHRSSQVHRAVIHATHSLSVPVRLGIAFMKTTKTSIWSVEHSLCSLESAIFLKYWLDFVADKVHTLGTGALRKVESQLLVIIRDIIKGTPLASTLSLPENSAAQIERMGSIVLEIWSTIFQGVNVLDIENTIGAGLQVVAST